MSIVVRPSAGLLRMRPHKAVHKRVCTDTRESPLNLRPDGVDLRGKQWRMVSVSRGPWWVTCHSEGRQLTLIGNDAPDALSVSCEKVNACATASCRVAPSQRLRREGHRRDALLNQLSTIQFVRSLPAVAGMKL